MIIVNLGSNDCEDFTFNKIRENQEKLEKAIIVEADEEIFKSCVNLYEKTFKEETLKKIEFLNVAIVDNDLIDFVWFYPSYNRSGCGSLSERHVFLHQNRHGDKQKTKAKTLNKILSERGIDYVDYLQIDCEGMDARIILSIDFEAFNIKQIQYENLHLNGSFNLLHVDFAGMVKEKLEKFNYTISEGEGVEGWDNIAIKYE